MKQYLYLPCLALLLASCSPNPAPLAPKVQAEASPVDAITRPAEEQAMPRYLRVTGDLEAAQQAKVAADVSGKVVSAPIERGSIVQKGDVLIKLDDRNAKLSLQEAEASLAATQSKLDWQRSELARNEPLAKTKAIADTDYQKMKIELASAEANQAAAMARRDMAQKALADTNILAPFAGTVSERMTEVGEFVTTNFPIANLVALDRLRLTLNVPETAVGQIREGQEVGFSVPAYPGQNFTGIVKYIGASVRAASRDLVIEAEVANADGRLKPGMFSEARITLAEVPGIIVPVTALLRDGNTRKVFIVLDGRIVERLVEVGETKGEFLEIRRGVAKGDAIIVNPNGETIDGRKVNVAKR
jgi:membrane fusion protein (multidrug efflux system)